MDPLQVVKDEAIEEVDRIASQVGMNFITAESNYIIHEYNVAAAAAKEWLKDISEPCPQLVTSWAQSGKMSNVDAAEYMIKKAFEFENIVAIIRQIRLSTKVIIRECTSGKDIKDAIDNMRLKLNELYKLKPL